MSFPRYPKYKASGVEWLGEVPEGWEVVRLRQLGPLLKGSGGSKEDIVEAGVPCVRYGDLYTTHSFHISAARTFVTPERAADYTELKFGDVLFAASGEKLAEIGKSAVSLIKIDAVCGGDIVILRPSAQVDPRFLGYASDAPLVNMQKAAMGRGTTVKHIYPDEVRSLLLPFPPLPEQLAIAAFLDRETAKIDELVEAQARLIELLKEKRQAVISHAVTKGLNPHAPMKPSGIEWLGEVPEGWEVPALSYRYRVELGKMLDAKQIAGTHLCPYVRNADVQWGRINIVDLNMMDFEPEERARFVLRRGDLLVCEGGEVGRCAVWDAPIAECYYQKALHRLRAVDAARDEVLFLRWLLEAATASGCFAASEAKATIAHLPAEVFRRHRFAFPPLPEQLAIVAFLDRETARIDTLTTEAQRAIDLLRERRSALISAAVTGQIDVRNAVTLEVA